VLLSSIPVPDPEAAVMPIEVLGEPPSPVLPPSGCRFHPRCPAATEVCTTTEPQLRELAPQHFVACHNPVTESVVAVDVV
jgi:oligopeptide/dipeptide ABC transporter ATP-binding protein